MKVTLKEAVNTPLMSVPAGTIEIDDELAAELIAEGRAVAAAAKKPVPPKK